MNNALQKKVVLGTWPMSGDFGHVPLSAIEKVLCYALEKGFDTYDTAPNYGSGFMEFALGKVFRSKEVRVNTKVGNHPFFGKDFSPEKILQSVDQSIKRLGRPIHVLFLHNPRDEIQDFPAIVELLDGLKKEGKIAFSGLSLAKGHLYDHDLLRQFDFLQNDVNLLYLDPIFQGQTTKLMARSPLASGILGGHLTEQTSFPTDDHRSGWLKGERLKSLLKRVSKIQQVSGIPVDSVSRKFLLQRSEIDRVIFGVKRIEHIDAIIQDLNSERLSEDLSNELVKLYEMDFGLNGERHLSY